MYVKFAIKILNLIVYISNIRIIKKACNIEFIIYKCEICNKQFKFNSLYLKHKNKKNPCQPVDINNNVLEKKNKINNEQVNIINEPMINLDNKEIDEKKDNVVNNINNQKDNVVNNINNQKDKQKYKCELCNTEFKFKSFYEIHKNNNCKVHKDLISQQQKYRELINKLKNNTEIATLKEEIKKLKEENNKIVIADNNKDAKNINITNNKITNNLTNNNLHIHLNSFGKEDLSHITDEDYRRYINTIYIGLVSFIKHIHCSEEKPSICNIYLEDVKSKSIKIFQDNEWLLKDTNEILTQLKDDKLNILDKKVDELKDDKLKTKLHAYKTRLNDNQDATKILTNKIKDALYNSNDDVKALE
jgi:hypothetical protein